MRAAFYYSLPIGMYDSLPIGIYGQEYSTGRRICDDFEVRLRKLDSLQPKIREEAEKRRDDPNMFHKGFYVSFADGHKLTTIIGDSFRCKIDYQTYQNCNEFDKAKFARTVSKIILNAAANDVFLSNSTGSNRPHVKIHLGPSMTQAKLETLLVEEYKKDDSKLAKLGIPLKKRPVSYI